MESEIIRYSMQNIEKNVRKDDLYYQDKLVFKYHIEYPVFQSTCNQRAAESINEYYLSQAKRKEHFCKLVLYPQAVEAARYIPGNNPPFPYYEFDMGYTITWNSRCNVSLFMEEYTFMGGAHGSTIRTSDTWNFKTGKKMFLKDFYGENSLLRENIIKNIEHQITEKVKTAPESFFDNYAKLLRDKINLNSFYAVPDGIIIYFQQYDIAPYAAGFPEFLLPQKL